MRGSILLVDMPAPWASSRCVARVNKYKLDPSHPGLVGDELSQLRERPRGKLASLRLSSPNTFTDASQFLHGNTATGAFGLRNQSLGDGVVNVASKAAFLPLTLLEEPSGCLGVLLLEPGPEFSVTLTDTVDLTPREGLTIRVIGDIHDPKVNPEEVFRVSGGRLVHLTDSVQIEAAVVVDEVSFSLAGFEELSLSFSGQEGDLCPTRYSPNGDVIWIVTQDAIIIGNGAPRPERSPDLAIQFIGIGYLRDAADNHLSCEGETGSHFMVGELVELILTPSLSIPGYLRDIITGSIGLLHSLKERLSLFWRRLKFNVRDNFHKLQSSTFRFACQV